MGHPPTQFFAGPTHPDSSATPLSTGLIAAVREPAGDNVNPILMFYAHSHTVLYYPRLIKGRSEHLFRARHKQYPTQWQIQNRR